MARPAHDYARVDKHVPVTRRAETTNPYSPVTILIALVATLGILLYAQFLLNPANRGDFLPYALVITAETILITHALLAMWTILSGAKSPRDFAFYESQNAMFDKKAIKAAGLKEQPHSWPIMLRGKEITIDVFITVYGEDLANIRRTAAAARCDQGQAPHLDPRRRPVRRGAGRSPTSWAATTCAGCSSNGAKAGNINHALSIAKGDFFCDLRRRLRAASRTSSSRPCRSSSTATSPSCRRRRPTATSTWSSRGAGYMQAVFYKFIQPGRNHFNAAFCVGTNVIFRRAAVDDIGGIYTDSKSEDVWTSLMLHERGWRSDLHPRRRWPSATPRRPSRPTPSSSCAGRPAASRSCSPTTRSARGASSPPTSGSCTWSRPPTTSPASPRAAAARAAAGDLLRPPPGEPEHRRWHLAAVLRRLLRDADRAGVLHARLVPLGGADAGRGVVPDLHAGLINAFAGKDSKWHVTGGTSQGLIAVQLHDPAGAGVLLPAADLARRDLARLDNSQLTLATAWNVTNTLILGAS